MARPRAAPSVGSVPAPSSSSRTRLFVVGGSQDVGDARDVRAEGAERLFQALLVADVGEDVREDRHAAALAGRDVHARLGHQAEQAGRLQADRLAAGVRPGDDEQVEADAETDVDGHDFARGGRGEGGRVEVKKPGRIALADPPTLDPRPSSEQMLEQRMAGLPQPESALGVDVRGVHGVIAAEAGLGGDEIEPGHDVDGVRQRPAPGRPRR